MACVRQLLCFFFFIILMIPLLTTLAEATSNISLPGCPSKCGKVTIPYPFGMGNGCYREGFQITCDESMTHPRAILFRNEKHNNDVELINVNITTGEARVLNKNISYVCFNGTSRNISGGLMFLGYSPFVFSNQQNKFVAIGCRTLAYIVSRAKPNRMYFSGCVSTCSSPNSTTGDGGPCNGLGCCQAAIPAELKFYSVFWSNTFNDAWRFNPCSYAMLVEDGWYKFQVQDLTGLDFYERNKNGVPVVLNWAIRDSPCQDGLMKSHDTACRSRHSFCHNTRNGNGYLCQCRQGYEGNPYLTGGCIDIDECKSLDKYPCSSNAICMNSDGNFTCSCPKGTYGNPYVNDGICIKIPEKFSHHSRVILGSTLGGATILILGILVVMYIQCKKRMEEKEEYQKYYQMMNDHLRVFRRKQLENATNNFNETNVLGEGGQGKVYKGLLENNQVIAIKKARAVEETQREEFVNEIILLSQINHKNIVRLLGCCLDVKIPMLVYEFVPNGTIYHLLHRNKTSPISLGTRLNIALESAVALDYIHSSISRTIIHGDIKSANILLDADYTVKVSDFGASSVVPADEIIELVHFSRGMEAVYLDEKGERQALATSFLSKARTNEHRKMLDVDLISNNGKVIEILDKICAIVGQCLSPKGDDRPTMSQIVQELQKIARLHNSMLGFQSDSEEAGS
ncbi:Wall-associated kinase family protein [Rhynchospora pubera]|uniref:Wall-associated kinase family protein n=1 Tax=Rhynchospora pubera TaxID=906938 RepID=A0AAV8H8P2_9POAL|nr:Wall-associated kinase family protein [Rhynchospora pubera]